LSTIAVTDATFQTEVLEADLPTVVDFWAAWCGPCRALSPILESLAEEHADRIRVVTVDVEANPETAARYSVISLPAIKVFVGGEVVKAMTGAKPRPVLESELADFIG